MAEYLSPGVYVEEIEIGAKPIEGVSTSTVGFLGETERGPTEPRLITSFSEFQRIYGGYFNQENVNPYLPYAVEGFFANGGARCYISRIVSYSAKSASVKLLNSNDEKCLTVKAVGEGSWGNRIAIKAEQGTFNSASKPLFKLIVYYWSRNEQVDLNNPEKTADIKEIFDNLSVNPLSENYFEKKVNGISNLIIITKEAGDSGDTPTKPDKLTPLQGGDDGSLPVVVNDYIRDDTDEPGKRRGLTAFKEIDEISIVYAPNPNKDLVNALISHCETLKDRFAIIDCERGLSNINDINPRNDFETSYAAYYYPWIKVYDPLTKLLKLVPPGGHVAGVYARTDIERGIHKAPANETLKGVIGLEFQITKGEQDILNPRGVNCIRAFPGRGIRIWGARTLSDDPLWKYINVRRLLLYIEESIEEGTQWVVFEPNDERLWGRVRASITEFLTRVWRDGALMGKKPEEAFFVKCDRTTMTQNDIDNGRLICVVGVAPVKPAEFVIFRIAQWSGGAEVIE